MINTASVPYHIGIIMDGNGRWASERGLPRSMGHQKGAEVVKDIVQAAADLGVKALTLFGFSEENWSRPNDEVSLLLRLAETYLKKELNALHEENVRFRVIGNKSKLPKSLQAIIDEAEQTTINNDRFFLNLALSYSGKWDIIQAVKKIVAEGVDPETITEEMMSQHLSLHELPDPELLIRTSGEQRISNFLLWQAAYSELYFCNAMWPDFNKRELTLAIESYQQRHRRFGKV
ncbi:MAG: isoprenyl transferase [Alphaproteobacteria bacterium]|nr:isoprenyl transferase [Alphaproteobacteria bacterium]